MADYKGRSLYHLLNIRAKQLTDGADEATQTSFTEIQNGLQTEQTRDWYVLKWTFRGKEFELNLPLSTFEFYLRGDDPRAIAKREGEKRNYRAENWQAAGELWRRMLQMSGAPAPNTVDFTNLDMGLRPAPPAGARTQDMTSLFVAVTLAAVLAGIGGGPLAALISAATAVAILTAATQLRWTHLNRSLHPAEALVIGAGTAIPGLTGLAPLNTMIIALAAAVLALGEAYKPALRAGIWLVAGGLAGLASHLVGVGGWWIGGVTAVALVVAAMFAPERAPWPCVAGFFVGLIALGIVPLEIALDVGTSRWAALDTTGLVAGVLVLVAASCWWIHGVMRRLSPWFGMVALGLFATISGTQGYGEGAAILGFAAVVAWRLSGIGMPRHIAPATPAR